VGAYGLSILAGGVTVLNPCVLPLLPIILATSLRDSRYGPMAFTAGLVVTFTIFGVGLTYLSFAFRINTDFVRLTAAVILALAGIIMIVPQAQSTFIRVVTPMTGGALALSQRMPANGLAGQFLLGCLLGIVWTPCTGPTLAAAVGMAAQADNMARSASIMLVFGIGVSVPLLALAYGSRTAIGARRDSMRNMAKWAKPVMGIALLWVGIMILTGWDRALEAVLVNAMPLWLVRLTTMF
jgi:cytochrome c-type biogenesis protein